MAAFALRRLLATILVLLAASALTFVLVERSSDPLADLRSRQPAVPAATITSARDRLYLDRSLPDRYWLWVTGIGHTHGDIGLIRGRWGPSVQNVAIGKEIRDRFVVTFRLVIFATVLVIALSILIGSVGAVRRNTQLDHGLTVAGLVALATPTFFAAAVLKEGGVWANQRLGTRVFYTVGATSPGHSEFSAWGKVTDVAGHLALPTLALVLGGYTILARHQRAAMLEVLESDYVRLARAKGLRNRVVLRRHAIPNSLIPATTLGARVVASALAGSVIIEQIFRWRGLGTFLLTAIGAGDTFAVMAFVVIAGVLVVATNLAADLLYAVLDPRIRRV